MGVLGLAGGAMCLPMDTVFFLPEADTAKIYVSGQHQTGRSTFNARAVEMDSASWGTWKTQDTALLRQNEDGIWAGDAFWAASLTRGSVDVVWRWWTRTNGLGAPDASLADHAWLQEALARWRAPLPWGLRAGLLGGGLVEHQDPGTVTLGLDPGQIPGKGAATGLWGTEAGWAGGTSIPSSVEAMGLEDQGNALLPISRRSVGATFAASLSGDGSDSLHLYGGWDSLRLRSERFLTDRTEGVRQAGGLWSLPAGGQIWTFDGLWISSDRRDLTGRSQGQDLTGTYGDVDLSGNLGAGWSHHHRLSRSMEDRTWFSEDSMLASQDRKDRDRTEILMLSDTLRWTTDRAGGWTALAGLVQSLRQVRHPWNPTPSSTDRPDEDLSRRTLTGSVFSSEWGWGEHPLVTWNTLLQEDVFPRGVQSIQTSRRLENRFSADLDPSPLDVARLAGQDSSCHWLRPIGGVWGREQRNLWRFDSSRTEGLLEEGWSVGLE